MSYQALHMRTRLVDGRVIASSPTQRRIAMRTIFRLATDTQLLAASLVDAHLHVLSCCSERSGSRFIHAVGASLKQRLSLPVGFAMYPHEVVRDARHLRYAFRYVHTQHEHHGLQNDPLREGTTLQDLLGLRLAGSYTRANVRRWLPRVSRAQLLGWLGVASLDPADGPLEWIHEAALSAAFLPTLAGKSPRVRQARRAVVEVVGTRWSSAELAGTLQVTQRSVQRLRQLPVNDQLVRAIRLQLDLRARQSLGLEQPSEQALFSSAKRGVSGTGGVSGSGE